MSGDIETNPPAPTAGGLVPSKLPGGISRLAPLGLRHGGINTLQRLISGAHIMLASNIIWLSLYPHTSADDKPGLHDLLYMSYTGEDGRDVQVRLMQQVRPHWRELAIALKFPQHEIAIMESKDNPVYYLLSEWLRGANQEKDPRPVTWKTLIEALQHADIQEEATILKKHFIQVPVAIPNAAVAGEYV